MILQNGFTVLRSEQKKIVLNKLKNRKGIAYYRQGSFSDEIIWQGRKFLFPSKKRKLREGMWAFRSVMSDVRLYLGEKKRLFIKERLPVNRFNKKNEKYRGKITATDVDHAYWRIAFLMDIISEKTYNKGLEIKDKAVRLAALANLASRKEYFIIEDGKLTKKTIILKFDPLLQRVYNNIRFTCYEHMNNMANLLGDDFIAYKTDCIYYKDTPLNRKMCQDYLEFNNLLWKQLIEPERPTRDEIK